MTDTTKISHGRNQAMECFKLIASILVLLVHAPFSGSVSTVINVLARCAVPGFFAISGFFSYGRGSAVLTKRLRHILLINLAGFGAILVWNCFAIELDGGSSIGYLRAVFPTAEEAAQLLLINLNYLNDTLWYLPAILECYILVWGYVTFFGEKPVNYTPLYIVSFCLYCINLLLGTLSNAVGEHAIFLYRNALFFGLPMFSLGCFLRQYGEQILENFHLTDKRLLLVILGGLALAFLEWIGCGVCDSMLGCCIAVTALMLLMSRHPRLSEEPGAERLFAFLGSLSTGVYLLHSVVIEACDRFLGLWFSASGSWLRPVTVLLVTLAAAAAWLGLVSLWKKLSKSPKKETAK